MKKIQFVCIIFILLLIPVFNKMVGKNEIYKNVFALSYLNVERFDNSDFNLEFDDPYQDIGSNNVNCDTLGTLRKDLNSIFNIIKIVAPILIVVFSIYDFIKAAAGKVDGEMKKAFSKLLKRIIFAIILFFLPTILDYFLGLVNPGYTTCINS